MIAIIIIAINISGRVCRGQFKPYKFEVVGKVEEWYWFTAFFKPGVRRNCSGGYKLSLWVAAESKC